RFWVSDGLRAPRGWTRRDPAPAVLLDSANPVEIRGQRRVTDRQATGGLPRSHVQRIGGHRRRRITIFANRLERGCSPNQHGGHDPTRDRPPRGKPPPGRGNPEGSHYLKSLLEKITVETISNAAM